MLYAFDPHPSTQNRTWKMRGTKIIQRRSAAWTHDGSVVLLENGAYSRVAEGQGIDCFRLATFVLECPERELILKLDCEGSEHMLIPDLIATGADECLSLLLVEWHPEEGRDRLLELRLACPVLEWRI